jgi:hypothetical protein
MLNTIVQKDGLIRLDGLPKLDYIENQQTGKGVLMFSGKSGNGIYAITAGEQARR